MVGGNTTRFVGELYENSSGLTSNYIYLGGIRVAVLSNSAVKYYHADHLGSANVMTDKNGSIIDVAEYKPFGEFSRHDIADDEGYYFTDQYNDEETALYYYGARFYNPRIGRFISPDWVVQAPNHSQSLNRYSYVWNNPVNATDPTGNIGDFHISESLRSLGMSDYEPLGLTFSQMLDSFQLVLDGFGMTEPFGFVFDGLNAGISLGRRDYVGAAIDGLAAIPAIGLYIRGADLAKTGVNAVDAVGNLRKLATENVVDTGKTVLGHFKNTGQYSDYISKAKHMDASFFDLGKNWDTLSDAQRWDANKYFLDTISKKGDQIYLNVPKQQMKLNSQLSREVDYLISNKNYQWVNQWSLRIKSK